MNNSEQIFNKLNDIEQLISEQSMFQKEMLDFKEAKAYISVSDAQLYKLVEARSIPHYKPSGRKLYFKRTELLKWLQANRIDSKSDINSIADEYITRNPLKR